MWSLTLVCSVFCLKMPILLADSLHSCKMCQENAAREWVQRSCWAGRRVTPTQKHQEMLRFKLHKTSVAPGQAFYSLVPTAVFRCLLGIWWVCIIECNAARTELGQGWKSLPWYRPRRIAAFAYYKLDKSFSCQWFKGFIFWFIWSGVLTDEHFKEVDDLS